jgi:hypothetical protein
LDVFRAAVGAAVDAAIADGGRVGVFIRMRRVLSLFRQSGCPFASPLDLFRAAVGAAVDAAIAGGGRGNNRVPIISIWGRISSFNGRPAWPAWIGYAFRAKTIRARTRPRYFRTPVDMLWALELGFRWLVW